MYHLRPVAGDAAGLVLLAHHKAGDVLQEHKGRLALGAQFDEVGALDRRFAEQDAVVCDNADRVTVDAGESAHQGFAVQRLEFVEIGAVYHTRNDFPHIIRLFLVRGDDAVNVLHRVQRCQRLAQVHAHRFDAIQATHCASHQLQRVVVVIGVVVGDAGGAAVHIGPAQLLGADDLAGGGFHQRRPAEENRALVLHDDGLVRHCRQVGTAGGAGPKHGGDLGNAHCRHPGLVVEGVTEMLPVGEYLVLQRQKGAA